MVESREVPSTDVKEIATFYAAHRGRLRQQCSLWSGRGAGEADDLLSESTLRLLERRGRGPIANLSGFWAATIQNAARDHLRSKRRLVPLEGEPTFGEEEGWEAGPDPERSFESNRLLARALKQLDGLPSRDRQALLARISGQSYEDIAELLGTTPPNARRLVCDARGLMRLRCARRAAR